MMLTSQAQQIILAISSYLINLLSIICDIYCKTLRLKTYSDTLMKHLPSVLDYAKVELFQPPMLCATHGHCVYQKVGPNSLQMVYVYTSGLSTGAHPRTGAP